MQNPFWQSVSDSRWFLIFFKRPPLHGKCHFKFPFLLLEPLPYVYIVVEVTINRAEYGSQRSQQPANVKFEPITIGPKSDIFD